MGWWCMHPACLRRRANPALQRQPALERRGACVLAAMSPPLDRGPQPCAAVDLRHCHCHCLPAWLQLSDAGLNYLSNFYGEDFGAQGVMSREQLPA